MFMIILALAATIVPLPGSAVPAGPSGPSPTAPSAGERVRSGPVAQAPAHVTTLFVSDMGGPDGRAVIIRRPGVPANLILVTERTTPADFLRAMRALNSSRRAEGEEVAREIRAFVSEAEGRQAATADPEVLDRAARHLARVKAAPEREVEGVGRYPAVTTELRPIQQ